MAKARLHNPNNTTTLNKKSKRTRPKEPSVEYVTYHDMSEDDKVCQTEDTASNKLLPLRQLRQTIKRNKETATAFISCEPSQPTEQPLLRRSKRIQSKQQQAKNQTEAKKK
eukprot:167023_1